MNPPIVTKDPVINVITTLAAMLGSETARYEALVAELSAARDALDDSKAQVAGLESDLAHASQRITNIEDNRDYYRDAYNRAGIVGAKGKAALFDIFLQNPGMILVALAHLRSTTVEERGSKIRLINEVREKTGLGLKEAKDMVLAFVANPTPMDTRLVQDMGPTGGAEAIPKG